MAPEYYTLPLQLDKIMLRDEHPKCSLRQSVAQHIHLIITTAFGEMQHDETFGCSIWDTDFDNLTAQNKAEEQIKDSLTHALAAYETRLQSARVEVAIRQEELSAKLSGRRVKRRIDVAVMGLLANTRDQFSYQDRFFMGPLSYY